MDRIDCFRAFVRALEGGSFSAAAKELGIGQPAVSKRIALLEGEFGTQLFLRTTRKLRPTPEAHRIYDLARQILGNFDTAKASVEEASPRPSGTLWVSLPSSFGRRYMMPIIAEYVRNYPEVRVDIRFSERFVNLVEEGDRTGAADRTAARRARWSPAGSARSGDIWLRPRPTCTAARCRGRRKTLGPPLHRLFPASRRPTNGPSNRSTAVMSLRSRAAILIDDADAMEEAVRNHLGVAILPEWNAIGGIRSGRAGESSARLFHRRAAIACRVSGRCSGCRCVRDTSSIS